MLRAEGRLLKRIHNQAGLEKDAEEFMKRTVEVVLRYGLSEQIA